MKSILQYIIITTLFFSYISVDAQIAGNWSPVGPIQFPTNVSGQINGIGRVCQVKFHPTDSLKMYAVSASGGLWISNDNANSWHRTGTDSVLPMGQCASVCIDYTNDSIIYLGTGDPNYYSNGYGIYKSTDGGVTWSALTSSIGTKLVIDIEMDPLDHNVLVAATNNGIYKSIDGGVIWSLKNLYTQCVDMKMRPAPNTRTLYVASYSDFLKSDDFGDTWTTITNGIAVPGGGNGLGLRIAVTAADSNVVYVGMDKDEGTIFRSNDGGNTFVQTYHNPAQSLVGYDVNGNGQGNYNFSMTADPTNANIVYTAAHCVWKSIDGGITWTQLTQWFAVLHTDMHHILFNPYNPIQLFNANDGGVWLSTNGGTAWTPKSNGLDATEVYHAASDPLRKDLISIGTQDNGELYEAAGVWKTNRGGDWDSKMEYDYFNINRVYYLSSGNRQSVFSGGETAFGLPFTPTNSSLLAFSAMDPTLGIIATSNLYESNDLYDAVPFWYQLTGVTGTIKALHIDQNNPNTLYVGKSNKIMVRVDDLQSGTPTYTSYTVPGFTSSTCSITTVSTDTSVVYLAGNSKVYRSPDKGATWVNISANLPAVNIIKIINDYYSTDESVYICSAVGVWYKNNTMTNWVNFSGGLPAIATINEFMIYNDGTANSRLRVAYYGRGVWESPLYSTLMGIHNAPPATIPISISPNPAADQITIKAASTKISKVQLSIVNINGQQLTNKIAAFTEGKMNETINVSKWSPGIYFVKIISNGAEIAAEKFEVIR